MVQPSKGVLEPNSPSVTINIKLRPIKNPATFRVARQKFMVEVMEAPEGSTVDTLIALVSDKYHNEVLGYHAIFLTV